MTPPFPDVSVQSLSVAWWETETSATLTRGRLIKVVVPYPDMKPFRLVPIGRGDNAKQHDSASYRLEEFRTGQPVTNVAPLPVAGLPLRDGETYLVRRGKTRPALVIATSGQPVPQELRAGAAKWQSNPTLLVAPYYGATRDGTRAGWNPEFVQRIQRVEYPQYVWDQLPIGGSGDGSIMRLDQVFPVGADPSNWELTPHRLSAEAMAFIDEWFYWHVTGGLPGGGILELARTELAKL